MPAGAMTCRLRMASSCFTFHDVAFLIIGTQYIPLFFHRCRRRPPSPRCIRATAMRPGPGTYNPSKAPTRSHSSPIVVLVNGMEVQFGGTNGTSQFASKVGLLHDCGWLVVTGTAPTGRQMLCLNSFTPCPAPLSRSPC